MASRACVCGGVWVCACVRSVGPGSVEALANCGAPPPPPTSSVFEVLSGQGGLSLGRPYIPVHVRACVIIVSRGGRGLAGRDPITSGDISGLSALKLLNFVDVSFDQTGAN